MDRPSFSLNALKDMANALRLLAIDAIEKAQSGHPGMPLGMADVATVLWSKFLRFDPREATWPGRDRFILSAGHGSMLLYGLMYLTGFPPMTLEELKRFRSFGSLTPGHPEFDHTPGVESTTGPLAQGLANGVGFALAEKLLATEFEEEIAAHWTYVIVGDGCLMEGLSQEAISFAGHLGLGRLIVLFDDNGITIDGPTTLATSEDHSSRFKACGWHVQTIDGHDFEAIDTALTAARTETNRPSFIACRTTIGYGAPNKAGTPGIHGSPLGAQEAQDARTALGGEELTSFEVPAHALQLWRSVGTAGAKDLQQWKTNVEALETTTREKWEQRLHRVLPPHWEEKFLEAISPLFNPAPSLPTRQWSQKILDVLVQQVPGLLGGSADLTPSNNTHVKAMHDVTAHNFDGRYIHYGIREHAMAGIMNGVVLHGGFIPYGGTFLAFSDYMRPAIRLAALMRLPTIFVMTHDSIGLGEDGPTHQPIEHLASLRAIPNLHVFRPACGVETAECWALAIQSKNTPSILALTRQPVPPLRTVGMSENLSARGAYIFQEAVALHQITLFATGSEVSLAAEVRALLEEQKIGCQLVSMPDWLLFEQQPEVYKDRILPKKQNILRVAIEAASPFGWEKYVGEGGLIFGVSTFGASAPYADLYSHFGLTPSSIIPKIKTALERRQSTG